MKLSNLLINNDKYLYFILKRFNINVNLYNKQVENDISKFKHLILSSKKFNIDIIPYLWTISILNKRDKDAFITYYKICLKKNNQDNICDSLISFFNDTDYEYSFDNINMYDILTFVIIIQYYFI